MGRDNELADISSLLERSKRDRHPVVVTVVGEPGNGKSALLAGLSGRGESGRWVAIHGYLAEREIPMSAATSAVRELTDTAMMASFSAGPEGLAPAFEAVHRTVRRRPTVVTMDDVQWVDDQSRALVHYLLRGAVADGTSFAVVAASRPDPRGVTFLRALTALLPSEAVVEIRLGPLDEPWGVALARRLSPHLSIGEAATLVRRAKGSPFWITSLARDGHDGLDERLDTLSPDAIEALAALVVAARPSSAQLLGMVTQLTGSRLTGAVDELVAAGLAVRRHAEVAVSHDLVRERAEATLPQGRAAALHRRFAAKLAGAESSVEELQLALQHQVASGGDGTDIARRLLEEDDVTRVGTLGLRTLVESLRHEGPQSQRRLGELAVALGELALAEERFVAAADLGVADGGAAAALVEAARCAFLRRDADRALELIATARARPDVGPLGRARCDLVESAVARWLLHEHDRARELTRSASASLPDEDRSDTIREVRFAVLSSALDDALVADDIPEVMRLARARASLARSADDRFEADREVVSSLVAAARYDQALDGARTLLRDAESAGRPTFVLTCRNTISWCLYELGRWSKAREEVREAAALEARLGPRPAARRARTLELAIRLSTDDWREAVEGLERNEHEEPDHHFKLGALQHQLVAHTVFGAADPDVVGSLDARSQEAIAVARCRRCGTELAYYLAEGWSRAGDPDRAQAALQRAPGGGRDEWLEQHHERARALVRAAEGTDSAPDRLLDLADVADGRGWRRAAVMMRIDAGRLFAARGDERAVGVLQMAATTARAGGAVNEAALADRWSRVVGSHTWRRGPNRPNPSGHALASLSPRELDIARLVADGASNPEIASRLFLSRKTIERHLSNIYRELGLRNRAELAATMREHEPRREGVPS